MNRYVLQGLAAAGLLALQAAHSLGNPTGGQVAGGSASITTAPGTVTVNQQSNVTIINWQSFSIGAGELTKFVQPSSTSAALNRVLGGNPSGIYGTLQSNGQVYLINPNGIVVGPGGVINTAAFIASTRDITDSDFLSGNLHFTGTSSAGVQNLGKITAIGGDVYLIGHTVDNEGTINAANGTVGLAAADDVLIAQSGNEHVFVGASATPVSGAGQTGVNNGGTIAAAAAELKAANGNVYALAINNSGTIRATTVKNQGGHVFLVSDSGTVKNSGTLDASATAVSGKGGDVTIKSGGTAIDSGAIVSRGGQGGMGGNAEISAPILNFTGTVDLSAPGGKKGELLLDPATLIVDSEGSGSIIGGRNDSESSDISAGAVEGALNEADVILNADNGITVNAGLTWTSGSTLTLQTNNSSSTITINAAINAVSGSLAIDTAGANDAVTTSLAGTVQVANFYLENGAWNQNSATLPTFQVSNDFEIDGGSFLRVTGGAGTVVSPYLITDVYGLQGIASLPMGNSYALANNIDASGTQNWNPNLDAGIIGDVVSLDFIPKNTEGFMPIGNSETPFTGTFDGKGFAIDGLFINQPNTTAVGLFGETSGAIIKNVAVTNAQITGGTYVGALVGLSDNGTIIDDCFSSGTVAGPSDSEQSAWVGGLVGWNGNSLVTRSQSSADVTSTFVAGGLVGENAQDPLSDSEAPSVAVVLFCSSSGSADGTRFAGGLVGGNYGQINNSYSTASANSSDGEAGGLSATIEAGSLVNCYSTGVVTGLTTGGLVGGSIYGTATNCFWDEETSGITGTNGAGTPETTAWMQTKANFLAAGWNIGTNPVTNIWLINDGVSYPTLSMTFVPQPPGPNISDQTNAQIQQTIAASNSFADIITSSLFGLTGPPGDNDNSEGNSINDTGKSKGKNIAQGGSNSGNGGNNGHEHFVTPGGGFFGIGNGGVSPVQPPLIILKKFDEYFNSASHDELYNAIYGSH